MTSEETILMANNLSNKMNDKLDEIDLLKSKIIKLESEIIELEQLQKRILNHE